MIRDLLKQKSEQLASLLESVKAGNCPMGLSTGMNSPVPVEMASQLGFDWIIVDQEHSLLSGAGMLEQIRAAERAGMPALVKVNENSPLLIRDALDAGASGIQLPGIDNVEMLEKALKDMKYVSSGGTRGLCPIQRSLNYFAPRYSSDYPDFKADEQKFATEALLIPTIETREGMLNLDAMLKIDECPIWHIGPFDLGQNLGISDMQDVLTRTLMQLAAKIHKAGKFVSIPVMPSRFEQGSEDETVMLGKALRMLGNDMPYTLDVACLAYGLDIMGRSRVSEGAAAKNKK